MGDLCNSESQPETHRAANLKFQMCETPLFVQKIGFEFVNISFTSDNKLTNGGDTKSVVVTFILQKAELRVGDF